MHGTAYYGVEFAVVLLLSTILITVPIFLIMKMLRGRREGPVWVSFEAAQKHHVLVYLIRIGEAILVVPFLLVVLLIGFGFLLSLDPFQNTSSHSAACSIVMLSAILLVSVAGIAKVRHRLSKTMPGRSLEIQGLEYKQYLQLLVHFCCLCCSRFLPVDAPGPFRSSPRPER